MFEKSLYDLIRGLRNHKGNERAYIQGSLRECRREIRSIDMDLKATALLKLTYLEMFGHDMSWASFNVLEVMSSQKYAQKRVGYLSAVQSFRPDTEVLMLAENLLKKDLSSPLPPTIALPLVSIPHVISAPMANSLLADLLPRLSHSHPAIRKKTIVTLYRLALVFPETLRPAWPKIKDRLLDEEEDSSVTAAVVNVVCELGWRRPADFLPLAPRLFELLVEGSNNWMAIKIVKLFAQLTPIEPRLVKKLLPPLTTLIKTTPAMSLLYECINGVIAAGILDAASGSTEGDETARLCVSKLRGMLAIEGDPNLKYVALLAFNKIVESHPYLVSLQEDTILECIDDADISIRLRALDLVVGMVNAQNLTTVVERLLKQLRNAPHALQSDDIANDRGFSEGVEPAADSDDEELQQNIKQNKRSKQMPPLPDDYCATVIQKILAMCSANTYANIDDFGWYIEVLISLVRHVPSGSTNTGSDTTADSVAYEIGNELRNVSIRVKSSRREAVQAAEALTSPSQQARLFPSAGTGGQSVLEPAVWIVGEFCSHLDDPRMTLSSLIHPDTAHLPAPTLSAYIQASMKLLSHTVSAEDTLWNSERKTMTTLLLTRMTNFLEPLTANPDLETQELAVQYLELTRLSNEAASASPTESTDDSFPSAPLLLTQALPSLFTGPELKPIARDAQHKVPLPAELDLDSAINPHLNYLLSIPRDLSTDDAPSDPAFHDYYYTRPTRRAPTPEPAASRLALSSADAAISYQNPTTPAADRLDPEAAARRRDRTRNDPFYIGGSGRSGRATPVGDALRTANGDELDVDAIPIMALDLSGGDTGGAPAPAPAPSAPKPRRARVEILGEEGIESDASSAPSGRTSAAPGKAKSKTTGVLGFDTAALDRLALGDDDGAQGGASGQQLEVERQAADAAEMAAALGEVERLRLEMARAQQAVEAREEVRVRRKKGRRAREADVEDGSAALDGGVPPVLEAGGTAKKKKKKKKKAVGEAEGLDGGGVGGDDGEKTSTKMKKKKKPREAVVEEA